MFRQSQTSTLFPYTTLFRSMQCAIARRTWMSSNGGSATFIAMMKTWNADAKVVSTPGTFCHGPTGFGSKRSEEHTSELQSHVNLVCRLLLEKKKHTQTLSNH